MSVTLKIVSTTPSLSAASGWPGQSAACPGARASATGARCALPRPPDAFDDPRTGRSPDRGGRGLVRETPGGRPSRRGLADDTSATRRRPDDPRSRRGAVLVAVLVCLVVIALMAATLLRLGLTRRARIRSEERTWQAEWLAESGLERASARLAADPAYRGETWDVSAADLGGRWRGRVVLEVEPVDRPGPPTFRVRSRADYPSDDPPGARRTREVLVGLEHEPNAKTQERGDR